jgi:polysaccharide export outer membrane protein
MTSAFTRFTWGVCLLLACGVGAGADVRDQDAPEPRRASQPSLSDEAKTSEYAYRIDAGDRVSIVVYQEPDLSVNGARVKADGTIAFPLLGDMRVAGLTSPELQDLVTTRLRDGYLKNPNVTVSIDSYRLYYIKGEVSRPGGYSFVDGLTVAKAVALAGGYTPRASESKITLLRETDPDNPLESVDVNTAIRPGDVITIGESFF